VVDHPIARSAIRPRPPVVVRHGWELSGVRSYADLRLTDLSPVAKILVRADADSPTASSLPVSFGSAARDAHGTLVVGSGPGEWLLLAPIGTAAAVAARIDTTGDRLVTVQDYTHGRTLLRLTGATSDRTLSKLCSIDLAERTTPNGSAFRSSVGEVVSDVIRDDVGGRRSYLLHCERSSGQYLFDVLLDAGREFGVEEDGFPTGDTL
jgi:heterotetrameric sarcosine oxidase gamma subunit